MHADDSSPPKLFTFDGVYFMDSTTEQIYNDIAYPLVEVYFSFLIKYKFGNCKIEFYRVCLKATTEPCLPMAKWVQEKHSPFKVQSRFQINVVLSHALSSKFTTKFTGKSVHKLKNILGIFLNRLQPRSIRTSLFRFPIWR